MKVSLVITVLNEEKTIGRLLDSLARQTKKPNEIIIVDGGSSDQTVAKIKNQKLKIKNDKVKLRIFIKKGTSIAAGSNFGIKRARYPIIAMTDAGCVAHSDWVEKITRPFTLARSGLATPLDVAAGFYRMTGKTVFQRCLACYLGVLPAKLDLKNFLPSTRSIAFKKEIWEKVEGFNESLSRAGEDTLFNYQAKRVGAKFVTVPDALVDWEIPKSWRETIKKFYHYAEGDAQALYWPLLKKIGLVFLRYWLAILLVLLGKLALVGILGIGYFLWAVGKNYCYVRRRKAILVLPVLQIVSDLAVMAGFIAGLFKKNYASKA